MTALAPPPLWVPPRLRRQQQRPRPRGVPRCPRCGKLRRHVPPMRNAANQIQIDGTTNKVLIREVNDELGNPHVKAIPAESETDVCCCLIDCEVCDNATPKVLRVAVTVFLCGGCAFMGNSGADAPANELGASSIFQDSVWNWSGCVLQWAGEPKEPCFYYRLLTGVGPQMFNYAIPPATDGLGNPIYCDPSTQADVTSFVEVTISIWKAWSIWNGEEFTTPSWQASIGFGMSADRTLIPNGYGLHGSLFVGDAFPNAPDVPNDCQDESDGVGTDETCEDSFGDPILMGWGGTINVQPDALECDGFMGSPGAPPMMAQQSGASRNAPGAESWGPPLWKQIHARPRLMRDAESERKWLAELPRCLPCGPCRTGYGRFIAQYPPDLSSPAAYARWGHQLHNYVNQELGKPAVPLDVAAKLHGWEGL